MAKNVQLKSRLWNLRLQSQIWLLGPSTNILKEPKGKEFLIMHSIKKGCFRSFPEHLYVQQALKSN